MLDFLKRHPFAVEAFFERSLVLTFAVPRQELAALLPPCLELDVFQDKWAFVAVALVETRHLRPQGLPAWLGNDFFLIGYRIFVRYRTAAGKRLRGLYILKSETDKRQMAWLGSLFTDYKYARTDLSRREAAGALEINSTQSGLHVRVQLPGTAEVALPAQSPFATWAEARRFAGPLPFTFSYNAATRQVLIVEGVREHWTPQPVAVARCEVGFLASLPLSSSPLLANAFVLTDVPYHWKKGRTELWQR